MFAVPVIALKSSWLRRSRSRTSRRGLAPAVDRDRQIEQDFVAVRQLFFEAGEDEARAGYRPEETGLHLCDRRQLRQLRLEGAGEPAVTQIPAVELLQEAGGPVFTQFAHGFAHEQNQLRDHFLPRGTTAVAFEDLL